MIVRTALVVVVNVTMADQRLAANGTATTLTVDLGVVLLQREVVSIQRSTAPSELVFRTGLPLLSCSQTLLLMADLAIRVKPSPATAS